MANKPLIEQLFELGGYQIKSQYRVMFPKGIPGVTAQVTGLSNVFPTIPGLTLRQDGSFPIPKRETGTFERNFQGLKATYMAPVENTSKQFSLTFLIDENFETYSILNRLYRRSFDDLNGLVGCEADNRFPIVLEFVGFNKIGTDQSFSFNKPPRYAIIFQACRISGLQLEEPEHSASEPLKATVDFVYMYHLEYITIGDRCSLDLNDAKYPDTTLPELPNYPDYKLDHPFVQLFNP